MSDVEEIKSRINIVDIIGKVSTLKKAGRNFKGLCPFHSEKTPSFIVSPERQTYHCFGCGKGGDVFSFLMDYHRVDFAEALEDLAETAGVELTTRGTYSQEGNIKQKLYEVNHLASEYYHYLLTKHDLGEKARVYLKNRGISDKSIKTFSLGYSPNSWDGVYKFLKKKGYDEEIVEKSGLTLKSQRGYYDRFRGRVMFTLKDHRGNVVAFAGRVLDAEVKEAKYINTAETPVYSKSNVLYGLDVTKEAIQKANDAVIMEGELDVISSFQAGIGNVVAVKGSALTEAQVRLLKRFTERIALTFDSDLAGDAAARRGIELADAAGLDIRVVTLPSGKDPDEAAREHPGLLKKAIKEGEPIYDYYLASAARRFDPATAFGKKKMSDELVPTLAKIDNPIVQNHYLKKVATVLGTSEDALTEAMRRVARGFAPKQPKDERVPLHAATRPETVEMYILSLLLQGKTAELFAHLDESGLLPEFVHPAVHKIMDTLVTYFSDKSIFAIKEFADQLPPELLPTLDEAFLWDLGSLAVDDMLLREEWYRALREFERIVVRRKLYTLTQEVGKDGIDEKLAHHLQQQLKLLSDKLKHLELSS